jgi:hypothetical protein
MGITRNGSRPSVKGAAEYFTGNVRIDPLFDPAEPARARVALPLPLSSVRVLHGTPILSVCFGCFSGKVTVTSGLDSI